MRDFQNSLNQKNTSSNIDVSRTLAKKQRKSITVRNILSCYE